MESYRRPCSEQPHVDWSSGSVLLATEAQPWPEKDGARLAAVSHIFSMSHQCDLIIEELRKRLGQWTTRLTCRAMALSQSSRRGDYRKIRGGTANARRSAGGASRAEFRLSSGRYRVLAGHSRAQLEHRAVIVA